MLRINIKLRYMWITALLCLLLGIIPAQVTAQPPPAPGPIILNIRGDLSAWNPADQSLTQLTDWGGNEWPILSPDGTRVAYGSTARVFVDWLATVSGAGGFIPPENIWMLDLPSQQTHRIADQPADAVYTGPNEGDPGRYIVRSWPAWSPDGLQLAWVEHRVDTMSGNSSDTPGVLVIHDMVSRTTRTLDSVPFAADVTAPGMVTLRWGEPGILAMYGGGVRTPTRQYRLYDPAGALLMETTLEVVGLIWIQHAGEWYLFDPDQPETWWDWRTGESAALPGVPEWYSLTAPDGARFFRALGDSGETWHLALPGQSAIDLGEDIRPYGISRDGQQAVYGRDEMNPETGFFAWTVLVHSAAGVTEIGRYQNVAPVWGPMGWRVRG